MSVPVPADPAKLVISLFTARTGLVRDIARDLEDRFGLVDLISDWIDFDYTDYYRREFGAPLFRRLVVFRSLIDQGRLSEIKHATNDIEGSYLKNGARSVNIDPGYLLRERFVLATGKNFAHRIYVGNGIYADLTMVYKNNDYQALPWTYPDYADTILRRFLLIARKRYVIDLQNIQQQDG